MLVMNPNKKSPKITYIFLCELCHYTTSNKKYWKKHTDTLKYKILTNPNYNLPNPNKKSHICVFILAYNINKANIKNTKNAEKYNCILCYFHCSRKTDCGKYILTLKTLKLIKLI
jgi:hypothetical protein